LEKKQSHLPDKLLVIASALLVACLLVGSILLRQAYGLPASWNFAAWIGAVFIASVGRSLRLKLGQALFVPFLVAWLAIHTLGTIMVTRKFGILSVVPFTTLEFLLGYAAAYRLFGLPTEEKNERLPA
jgi:hypothetical protein